jgi:PAS domain S-box-containing protein
MAERRKAKVPSKAELLLQVQQLRDRLAKSETALRVSEHEAQPSAEPEERLAGLLDGAPVLLWAADPEGRILQAQGGLPAREGVSTRELVGSNIETLTAEPTEVRIHLRRAMDGELVEAVTQLRSGAFWETHYSPLPDDDGTVIGVLGISTDISERTAAVQALRESEQRYRELVEMSPDAILVVTKGRVVFANAAAADMLGLYGPVHLVGKTIRKILPPDALEGLGRLRGERGGAGARGSSLEAVVQRPDGQQVHVELRAVAIRYGGARSTQLVLRDISERKRQEAVIRESNELLTRMFANTHVAMAYLRPDLTIVSVNATFGKLDGRDPDFFAGRRYFDLFPGPAKQKAFEHVVTSGEPYVAYQEPVEQAGATRTDRSYWDWSLMPVEDAQGAVEGLILSYIDVTRRVELERAVAEIGERERRRIGQDLHDTLGQDLTGAAFLARALQRKLARQDAPEAEEANAIVDQLNATIALARRLSRGLRPVELEPDGLMSALESLAADTRDMFGLQCHFRCSQPVLLADSETASQLYRIAQEAVNNATKHASASAIDLSLWVQDGRIWLAVADDGVGIEDRQSDAEGMGLHIMHYRARAVGGTLSVRSTRGEGTTITCSLPQSEHS